MLTNREMASFQKWDFFRFFLILLLQIVSLQEHEKKPIGYMISFIHRQQCIAIISSHKMCGFISYVFKKIISKNTTATFQEVGGVTQPRIFC